MPVEPLQLSNNWNITKSFHTDLAFKPTQLSLFYSASFYLFIYHSTITSGGRGDYYYDRINNFLLMCWGWGLLMADYLFWHRERANTENSGFFRENRYLDPGREQSQSHRLHLAVCLCRRVVEHLLRPAICLGADRNTGNLDCDSDNYTQKYIHQHHSLSAARIFRKFLQSASFKIIKSLGWECSWLELSRLSIYHERLLLYYRRKYIDKNHCVSWKIGSIEKHIPD